ncbi:MAG TPA: NADH-quinone oxidoreductase subunit NuoH [Thermodesulfobacteriota bacterium]|jgi:NADH-quinone oxidoreductase subunit H
MPWIEIGISVVKIALVLIVVLTLVAYLVYAERRIMAFIQDRLGPNRVGPFGLLQPLADGIKLIFKEDIVPERANKTFYILAPAFSIVTALIAFAVIPIGYGFDTTLFGALKEPFYVRLQIADINAGLLYVLAITSLGVYGIVLGGWSSNSKYSLLGGIRSAAQMVSYELSLALSVIGVIAIAGSLRFYDIIDAQAKVWFVIPQILGFLVFIISSFAETNRLPFDLPEAEPELVAGYHTEYSSMKFAMFYMAEYTNMITASALAVALFLGGWFPLPFGGWFGIDIEKYWFLPPIVFIGKVFLLLFLFIWVRSTLPRFRYDQLMRLGWKVLFPIAVLNLIITSAIILLVNH